MIDTADWGVDMAVTIKGSKLLLLEEDMDIYVSIEVKEALEVFLKEGKKTVTLDISSVHSICAPALQLIISASKTFQKFKIVGVNKDLKKFLRSIGVSL